jgi:hypothetical protein
MHNQPSAIVKHPAVPMRIDFLPIVAFLAVLRGKFFRLLKASPIMRTRFNSATSSIQRAAFSINPPST